MMTLVTFGGMKPPVGVSMFTVCGILKCSYKEYSIQMLPLVAAVLCGGDDHPFSRRSSFICRKSCWLPDFQQRRRRRFAPAAVCLSPLILSRYRFDLKTLR